MAEAEEDVLDAWVGRIGSGPKADNARIVADWLRTKATTDDWHRTINNHNWDYGTEPLSWIARQPRCEKATALMMFYLARPGQMLDYGSDRGKVPRWQWPEFDLASEVRSRFPAGFYTSATIAFDAVHAFNNDAYLPDVLPQADRLDPVIPLIMRESIAGRILSDQWDVEPDGWL
jgi:Domain of unknown function (DUF4274)